MKVGFTGTRYGMTTTQFMAFDQMLYREATGWTEFHHGDCDGADVEAGEDVYDTMRLRNPNLKVIIHPPVDKTHRANSTCFHVMRDPKTHFARNRDIVDDSDILVAAPRDSTHQPKGGTWYTVDYAKKKGKPVIVIWPNGSIERTKADESHV